MTSRILVPLDGSPLAEQALPCATTLGRALPAEIMLLHVDPIVGAVGDIGWLAVHVACNDIAASGIRPRWLQLLVLVPRIRAGAGPDWRGSGRRPGPSDQGNRPGGHGHPGPRLRGRGRQLGLSKDELSQGRHVMAEVSVIPEALVLAANGVTAMHDVTRGGILETLLEIAHLSEVGIELTFSRLPIPPIVSRFADAFAFDPLRMISSGTLAVTVPQTQIAHVSAALQELEMPFAFVGHVTEGAGVRVLKDGDAIHYAEIRCEEDELARMWALYPRHA